MKTIYIFDKNPLVISGLSYFLEIQGFFISGATSDPQELFRSIRFSKLNIVIIDPSLMKEDELSYLADMKRIYRELKIVVYAGSDCMLHILRSYRLSWIAYISKEQPLEKLVQILLTPPGDNSLMIEPTLKAQSSMTHTRSIMRNFTGRELQVLREMGAGKTNKIIAQEMQLSNKTISTYKRSIMNKLGTRNIRDVIDFARAHGF